MIWINLLIYLVFYVRWDLGGEAFQVSLPLLWEFLKIVGVRQGLSCNPSSCIGFHGSFKVFSIWMVYEDFKHPNNGKEIH